MDTKKHRVQETIGQEKEQPPKATSKKKTALGAIAAVVCLAAILLVTLVVLPSMRYSEGEALLAAGKYGEALEAFWEMDFKDSRARYEEAFAAIKNEARQQAEAQAASGSNIQAAVCFVRAGDPLKAQEHFDFSGVVEVGDYLTVGIAQDGKIYYQSNKETDHNGAAEISGMRKLLPQLDGITGLDEKGRIITHNLSLMNELFNSYSDAKKIVCQWENVRQLVASSDNFYALMENGEIRTHFDEPDSAIHGTEQWKDIVSLQMVSCRLNQGLLGIDASGRAHMIFQDSKKADQMYDVSDWPAVRKIVNAYGALVGITQENGLVIEYEYTYADMPKLSQTALSYDDVADVVYHAPYLAVLHADGTVSMEQLDVLSISEKYQEQAKGYYDEMVQEIQKWHGVVSLTHDAGGFIGIRHDGTALYVSSDIELRYESTGYTYNKNLDIAAEIHAWTDVVAVFGTSSYLNPFENWYYAVGLKSDGTLYATGDGRYYTTEETFKGSGTYKSVKHSGGTYHLVDDWKLW